MKISLKLFLTMFILWCKVEDFIAFADGKMKVDIGPTGSVFSLFIESMFCLWLWDHCAVIRIYCCSCSKVCWFMVYITDTFNNISIIVAIILLVEETGVLGENNRPHLHRLELSQQVNIISRNTYHYDKKVYKQSWSTIPPISAKQINNQLSTWTH